MKILRARLLHAVDMPDGKIKQYIDGREYHMELVGNHVAVIKDSHPGLVSLIPLAWAALVAEPSVPIDADKPVMEAPAPKKRK